MTAPLGSQKPGVRVGFSLQAPNKRVTFRIANLSGMFRVFSSVTGMTAATSPPPVCCQN